MLSNTVMGALGLAILWVNTLLVAGAAWKEIARLQAKLGAVAGARRGRVTRGEQGGAIAALRIDQIGRAGAANEGEEIILFSDRGWSSVAFGGTVEAGGEEIVLDANESVEVWPAQTEIAAAAACPSTSAFADAHRDAKKAKGFARTFDAAIREGDEVFVARAGGGPLLSAFDPAAWCKRKIALALAFIALEVAAAAGCTALALHPPVFGLVSTIGAALGLAFFLLVQPAGTALRDAVKLPSAPITRGAWKSAARNPKPHAAAAS